MFLPTRLCARRVQRVNLPQYLFSLRMKTRKSSTLARPDELEEVEPPAKRPKPTPVESRAEGSTPGRKRKAAWADVDKVAFPNRKDLPWKVGAHVSAVGGIENTILNAAQIGANAFALFLKSHRKWTSAAISSESVSAFKERMNEYGYSSSVILPHGNYLINLGNPDLDKREKSYACFLDDLKRCEELGLTLYNFQSFWVVEQVFFTKSGPGAGNQIGGEFAHLGAIIAQVEDKSRVGVCIDTLGKFDAEVGLSYLRGMHLNDSKTAHNSKKDQHENIGQYVHFVLAPSRAHTYHTPRSGKIGIAGFYHIMNDPRMQHIPLVLETPSHELPTDTWAKEITALNSLSGLDVGDTNKDLEHSIKDALEHLGLDLAPVTAAVKRSQKASGTIKGVKAAKATSPTKSVKKKSSKQARGMTDEDIEELMQEYHPKVAKSIRLG
ncbi:hypothetical protein DXG01_016517 [Tephrocybe rancida]|nr:hypothetical protein DXG01_016517 [Tephrocybe rancida]